MDGTVKVNATLSASGRRESFLFSDITADLVYIKCTVE